MDYENKSKELEKLINKHADNLKYLGLFKTSTELIKKLKTINKKYSNEEN